MSQAPTIALYRLFHYIYRKTAPIARSYRVRFYGLTVSVHDNFSSVLFRIAVTTARKTRSLLGNPLFTVRFSRGELLNSKIRISG